MSSVLIIAHFWEKVHIVAYGSSVSECGALKTRNCLLPFNFSFSSILAVYLARAVLPTLILSPAFVLGGGVWKQDNVGHEVTEAAKK